MSKRCIKCEKVIQTCYEETCLDEAGFITVNFGFGSRYDWIGLRVPIDNVGASKRSPAVHEMETDKWIASATTIRAYICDDCFKTYIDLFEGTED